NCPLERDEYEAFVTALLAGEKIEFHEWEKSTPYFEGCLPVEVMAARGADTLRFGPMKPVGLRDPTTGHRPHAVVQLRQHNAPGRRRAARVRGNGAALHDRAGRAAAPHTRRCRYGEFSADEHQFRTVPAALSRSRPACRPQAIAGAPGPRGFGCLAPGHRAGTLAASVSFRGAVLAANPESMNTDSGIWIPGPACGRPGMTV